MRNPAGDDAVERMLTQIEDLLKRQQSAARKAPPLDPGRESATYPSSDPPVRPYRELQEQPAEVRPRPRMRDLDGQKPAAGAADAGAGYDPDATQHDVAPYDPDEIVREIRELQQAPGGEDAENLDASEPTRGDTKGASDNAPAAPAPAPVPGPLPANSPHAAASATSESPLDAGRSAAHEPQPSRSAEPPPAAEPKPAPARSSTEPAAASPPLAPPVPTSRVEAPEPPPAAAPPPPPAAAAPTTSEPGDGTLEADEIDLSDARGGHPNGTHMTRRLTTRLGQMLTDANLLTEEQLEAALRKQQHTGERLGAVLINEGFVDEVTLLSVLESQYGVPAVDLDDTDLDPALVKLIPHDMARRNLIVPLAVHSDAVDVAMVDPTDFVAMAHVRFSAGLRPNVFITTVQAARRAIARLYDQEEDGGIPDEPLDRRQAIKRMILDRDSMLMAADQDPRKFYQLAATIDAFVDEILRKADSKS